LRLICRPKIKNKTIKTQKTIKNKHFFDMNANYQFQLTKRGKTVCPECRHKTFVLYINNESGNLLHSTVGKCDRADNCAYHYTPKQFFTDNPDERTGNRQAKTVKVPNIPAQPEKPMDYFDEKNMLATMTAYERNSFVMALQTIFDAKQTSNIIDRYKLGTTKSGGVIFWQVDTSGRIRYGKVMHYLPDLRRDKSKHPIGVHSLMGRHDFNHRQCFFGEYLLNLPENESKTVCIVESEKSACICSEVLQDFVWLATGGKTGIKWTNKNAWVGLQERKVVLFPDVDAHRQWVENAGLFRSYGINVSVFDILAKIAPETQQDIADHIVIYLQQRKEQVSTENVTHTHTITEPLSTRMLPGDEFAKLATKLPDYHSFTETELCQILNIKPVHVQGLADNGLIYFISLTGKYCRSGCTPF